MSYFTKSLNILLVSTTLVTFSTVLVPEVTISTFFGCCFLECICFHINMYKWCSWQGLNLRPHDYQSCTLNQLSYTSMCELKKSP